jgi:multidrug efflux system outer membrane protein
VNAHFRIVLNCLFLFSLLIVCCGCFEPHYYVQPIEPSYNALETSFKAVADDPSFQIADEIPQDWWELFQDDQLSHFIQKSLEQNPTLQIAQSKIESAKYDAERALAVLYPNITWTGDVLRDRLSKTGLAGVSPNSSVTSSAIPAPAPPGILPFYFTQYETALNLQYDFDIWGKRRNTLRASIGEMGAKIADEAFVKLNLSISVAQTYFQLQTGYARENIAKKAIENHEETVRLIQQRVDRNLDNEQTLYIAQSNLILAKQVLLQIQGNNAINEYQLKAYIAGDFEDEICEFKISREKLPRVPMPAELPLRLIAHRPDITSQLWIIESAGWRIEVAKAGFYPDVNLMAYAGFQTIHFKDWFQGRSIYAAVDPAFSLPLFDGGLLDANLAGSQVDFDQAILQYNQLVLNATRDVLTGIAVLQNANLQLVEFDNEVKKQNQILALTIDRIAKNLDSDFNRLASERQVLNAQDYEVQALGSSYQASLLLIKALGGGYEACPCNPL